MSDQTLQGLVLEFASDVTRTLRNTLGYDVPPMRLLVRQLENGSRITVRPSEPDLPLKVDGEPILRLEVSYHCSWDSSLRFLRVEESTFQVKSRISSVPLFRYDFVHTPASEIPGAHLNVHGHHDHVVWSMMQAGKKSRGGRRAKQFGKKAPGLGELHFPLGGPRFRPCLEDVLEMLICEFGLDRADNWRKVLADGRVSWRQKQLAAAMWDDPTTALQVAHEIASTDAPLQLEKLKRL